jgi:hypothetical protein
MDYIIPRKDDVELMMLNKDSKYSLVTLDILNGVIIDEDMLGKVTQLIYIYIYIDHDIIDTRKFPELAPGKYLELRIDPVMNQAILVPKVWTRGLERDGILNLFEIPHFGRREEVNVCVNMLLTYVHGGYLWLDKTISIDTDLIAQITTLLTQGGDPTLFFSNKKNDRALSESMTKKFHTIIWVHGLDVPSIYDPTIRFVTQALAYKLLRKCRKDEVPTGVIVAVEKCVEGVSMRWAPFLLNQFLINCVKTQDRGMKFYYS